MRLPNGVKIMGGVRLARITKTGRREVPAGAFGQSNYQKAMKRVLDAVKVIEKAAE